MSVAAVYRLLRCRWHDFARTFWPETPREQTQAELDRLDDELRRQHFRLLRCRQKIEKIRYSAERRSRRLELLAFQAQNTPADTVALEELERGRRAIDRLRKRLHERERAYDQLLARFRRRKQQRAELRERLLSSSLSRTAMIDEDYPDYPF